MVCNRCVMTVEDILNRAGIAYNKVQLGEVYTASPLTGAQKALLSEKLEAVGFKLIDDRISSMIERLKQLVIKRARNEVNEEEARLKLSNYLTSHLHNEYTYLSNLFSSVEGRTIENYFIEQRIEYVKELLIYDEMSLSEIALELNYSSTAHLSAQFKKVTGLTPSYYKEVGAERRKGLDAV